LNQVSNLDQKLLITLNGSQHHTTLISTPIADWLRTNFGIFKILRLERQSLSKTGSVQATTSHGEVHSPLPGKVVSIFVNIGDVVSTGELIATIESMKMEHRVAAPCGGRIDSLSVKAGDSVVAGGLIARLR
jgi:acetyl/propionyl-CoA carboxylase alpha subunit